MKLKKEDMGSMLQQNSEKDWNWLEFYKIFSTIKSKITKILRSEENSNGRSLIKWQNKKLIHIIRCDNICHRHTERDVLQTVKMNISLVLQFLIYMVLQYLINLNNYRQSAHFTKMYSFSQFPLPIMYFLIQCVHKL